MCIYIKDIQNPSYKHDFQLREAPANDLLRQIFNHVYYLQFRISRVLSKW